MASYERYFRTPSPYFYKPIKSVEEQANHSFRNHQRLYDRTHNASWRFWALFSVFGSLIALILFSVSEAWSIFFAALFLNIIIEYHKWFTAGLPLDFELLFPAVTLLTALSNTGLALLLVFIGPAMSELSRGGLNKEMVLKSSSLFVAVFVASLFSSNILFAVALGIFSGVCTQYATASFAYGCSPSHNIVRRFSTLFFAFYCIFFIGAITSIVL